MQITKLYVKLNKIAESQELILTVWKGQDKIVPGRGLSETQQNSHVVTIDLPHLQRLPQNIIIIDCTRSNNQTGYPKSIDGQVPKYKKFC